MMEQAIEEWPCFMCGTAVRRLDSAHWFATANGAEIVNEPDGGPSGAHPVGPECYKRLPESVKAWGSRSKSERKK